MFRFTQGNRSYDYLPVDVKRMAASKISLDIIFASAGWVCSRSSLSKASRAGPDKVVIFPPCFSTISFSAAAFPAIVRSVASLLIRAPTSSMIFWTLAGGC